MKEKIKSYFVKSVYKTVFAAGIFLILFLLNFFEPHLIDKISPVWKESINFQKVGKELLNLSKGILPF